MLSAAPMHQVATGVPESTGAEAGQLSRPRHGDQANLGELTGLYLQRLCFKYYRSFLQVS